MIKSFLNTIIDVIFPRICFACQKKITKGVLCNDCRKKIKPIKPPTCKLCAKEIGGKEYLICPSCRKGQIYYDRLISCFYYQDPLKNLLHLFKYQHRDFLDKVLADFFIDSLSKLGFPDHNFDILTAIPSHPTRLREREYNQSNLLAKRLSHYLNVPYRNDIILCKEYRPSQTKIDKNLRSENVKNIFEAKEDLRNKNIIVVDDVVTTGATLSECAKALKEKNAGLVVAITLAKAQ